MPKLRQKRKQILACCSVGNDLVQIDRRRFKMCGVCSALSSGQALTVLCVIASGAKQSRKEKNNERLLRHYVPRNDKEGDGASLITWMSSGG